MTNSTTDFYLISETHINRFEEILRDLESLFLEIYANHGLDDANDRSSFNHSSPMD